MYMNINNLKQLAATKKNIRKTNRGKNIEDENLYRDVEQLYKPLIEPMKKVATNIIPAIPAIQATSNIPAIEAASSIPAIEPSIPETSLPALEAPSNNPSSNLLRLGVLADRYLKTPSLDYDHAYGLKPVEGSTNFRLGRMDVKIDGDDFVIDDIGYKGTEGVWKLLTRKDPGVTSAADVATYKNMILQTRPFLLENSNQVKCNRGVKYKNIIKPIATEWKISNVTPNTPTTLPNKKRQRIEGSGVVFIPSDPDELVHRHKLLFGSYQAGNTGVYNELQYINDKLLELDVFDIQLVTKLNTVINEHHIYKR